MSNTADEITPAYRVALPVFEGPLDLLLHLIEREELDITQVSLAQVTDQYLGYLAQLQERDPGSLADFLVVAAKLLLIKSRVLLPRPPRAASLEEEPDPGEELIQQLQEYRRIKQAAQWLQEQSALGLRAYVRVASAPKLAATADLEDVTLDDLLEAVREVLLVKPPALSVNGTVAPVVITITDQMGLIASRISRGRSVSFVGLLKQAETRIEIVVTLLAVLEMIKQSRIIVRQDRLFSDILIESRPDPEPQPAPTSPQS